MFLLLLLHQTTEDKAILSFQLKQHDHFGVSQKLNKIKIFRNVLGKKMISDNT